MGLHTKESFKPYPPILGVEVTDCGKPTSLLHYGINKNVGFESAGAIGNNYNTSFSAHFQMDLTISSITFISY
jgi:hypothetical protein